jgi:hypothetical protein
MKSAIQNTYDYESWENFITDPNDCVFGSPLTRICSSEIICNTNWIDDLIDDNSISIISQSYQHDFRDIFENYCVEVSNFDPEQTTEEDIAVICGQCGEIDGIDMSQKSSGRICVTFFDLRSAYSMIHSTIRVRGFNWFIQFSQPEVYENSNKSLNNATIVMFGISTSVTDSMLIDSFSTFGTIREIRKWNSNRFIEFWDIRASEQAVHAMNGKILFDKKIKVELNRSGGFHKNSQAYLGSRMPTVARMRKGTKGAAKLEICRTTSIDQKSIINRVSRSARPPLVFSFGDNRVAVSA